MPGRKILGVLAGLALASALALVQPAVSGATGVSREAGPVPPPVAQTLPASAAAPLGTAAPAITYEWDVASSSGGPTTTDYECSTGSGTKACFQPSGDHWYVYDSAADGHSATASWYDYYWSSKYSNWILYREGSCVNEHGAGSWGNCNKNYHENHLIRWWSCVYDAGDGTWHGCYDEMFEYASA